ncbi:ABC transporter permease [Microbacterium marmarense]|uniref:ABC transporter permease n=1 Tax=Microbacterium marmarense TaxID=3122051 RepID=A0ABU8LQZ6_9MICO
MLRHVLKQVVAGVVLVLATTAITFALLYSGGTSIARNVLGLDASESQVAAKAQELGLDQPLLVQYGAWLSDLFHGSLGQSFVTGEPITHMLSSRIPVTLSLVVISMILMAILSVLIGVAAATKGGWIDRVLQVVAISGSSVPHFLIAIGLVLAFALAIPLLPATGYVPFEKDPGAWAASLTLPVLAILISGVAAAAQQFRGEMIDILQQGYIRTLRARGISERNVIFRHALRNASGPGLTILSLQAIGLFGGVIVIERVFALPGLGTLVATAARQSDIPAVMGCVLITVVVVVIVNSIADITNVLINPKSRAT